MNSRRSITVAAVALAIIGLTCNDWFPTGLLADVGSPGNPDRRDALRALSLIALCAAGGMFVWRGVIAENTGGIAIMLASTAFSLALFVAVDITLSAKAVRIARPAGEIADVHKPDSLLGWRPRPGTVGTHRESDSFDVAYVIDDAGYKAVPNAGEAGARLFIFGDSYTFGHGVANADTYANVIARDHVNVGVHVFNVGVMGYGVEQMYGRFLEIEATLKSGDIVVFAPTSQDIKRNLKDFVFPSKLIFGKRLDFGDRYPVYDNGQLSSVELDTPRRRFMASLFNGRWTKSLFRFIHSAVASPDTTREAREIVDIVSAKSMARGADFCLMFLPQTKERLRGEFEEDISLFDHIDVTGYFPSDSEALAAIRFSTDPHWNTAGHAIAARAVFGALRTRGLLRSDHLK